VGMVFCEFDRTEAEFDKTGCEFLGTVLCCTFNPRSLKFDQNPASMSEIFALGVSKTSRMLEIFTLFEMIFSSGVDKV